MKSSLRRSLFLFCVFTLIMGLTAGNVAAAQPREGELIQEVVFEKTDLMFSEYEDYNVVTLARHGSTGEIGKPSLPQASVSVVIPPGARVKRVEVISSESEILPGTYKIMPAQPPKSVGSEKSSVILNNIDYHAVTPFPGKLVQYAYTGSRGGYQVAGIFIYPLQYVPSEKSLRFYSSVKFKVIYQESTRPVKAKTPTQIEVFGDMVEKTVINPEDVSRWAPPVQSASENNHDYFIITSSEFVDEFQPLADWKNRKGVRTEIATIEDIGLDYSGSDLQEKIKNFIVDMEATYGAVYFLLGGDTNVVPHRLLTTGYNLEPPYGEPIPSDLYYSDLNGDLYSDVFVGRAPVENEAEATTFVNKVLTYEKNPPLVDYPLEALMMAFMLDSSSSAEDIKEECETHIPTPFNVDEFYQSQGEGGVSQAKARINQGFGILNHADHANYNAWGVGYYGGGSLMSLSDISSLTNGDEQSVIYSIGCFSAAIEEDCCAERFLNNPNGGGVSYIGNSRYGWYLIGDATRLGGDLDEEFYISLFSRGLYNLGEAHADAKDQWVDDASGFFYGPYYKYTILELNLLGDPEMPVWTDSISEMNATHLNAIPSGASEFTVTVTETGGTPIEGALVCCMMDDFSVYEKGYTGASGEVTLAVSPVHNGTMWITTSKHNYLPYEGFAIVSGQDEYTLTVNTDGNGSVAKDPDQATYTYSATVQLTADPDPGWSFSHWTGDLTGSTNPNSIIMTEDKTVTAHFTQDEYTLTVNTDGNGSVVKNPDQATYVYNTNVQLTANPGPGWSFSHWTGDLTGNTNPNSIIMTEDKTVTAHFTQDEYTLTVNTDGNGSVVKNPDQATYVYDTSVQLTANPDPGWSFSHWTGDLTGSANPDSIIMTEDKTVTAHFTQGEHTLDFANQDIVGSGTISGTYTDTYLSDNTYEEIEEVHSRGKSNKSYLEHKWTIDVIGGETVTFYVEAYYSPNSEGDDFEFSYSTDDQTYTYMLTVDKTAETSGYQTFSLPSNLSGTVYICVTDTDQTRGNKILDTIYIDHMYIESSPSTDTLPPSEVTDLSTSTGDYGQVILTWTAPGDDGMIGIASEYDIRYLPHIDGPIDATNWDIATQVTGEPTPSMAGTSESMTVGGLEPGASYYFAIKTADEVPNWSALSDSPLDTAGSAGTVKDFANQDIPISGRVSGDYTYTHSSDDSYQSITEVKSRGKVKHSYLEHKWTIDVTDGATVTFYVEAYHSSNSEGDDFEFSYSTDDQTYTYMLTVAKTENNGSYQSVQLPPSLSGTVYIRVTDTDQTIGNNSLDTIYIDYMYIESECW